MSAEMKKTILLVEDEVISAMAGKMALENFGNKVMTAYSGEEAVETVDKTPAIDLVLMDINLGAGIDGTEAAEIILKNHDLPVVFLSGHTEADVVGKTEKITSYGYIVKSSSSTVLDASIKMAFKLFEAKTREKEKESQREAALAALRESEEKYRTVADFTFDWETWRAPDGTYRYVSPSCERISGHTAAEFMADADLMVRITHPEDQATIIEHFRATAHESQKQNLEFDFRILTAKGETRWISHSCTSVHGEDGRWLGRRESNRDVSERKRAEDALQESEVKLRAILDATPFPIALVDTKDDKIDFWSRSALTLFGHTAPTAAEWYRIVYPDPGYRRDVVARWKPFLEKARKSGQAVNTGEYRVTCRDGSVRICELYAAFLADHLIVTFNDITERKRVEEALKINEALFREFYDNMKSGSVIFAVTNDGSKGSDYIVEKMNNAGLNMEGKTLEEVAGKKFSDIRPAIDSYGLIPVMKKVWETGESAILATKMYADERFANYYENYIFKLPSGEVVTLYNDVTESRRTEEALRESEEMFREMAEQLEDVLFKTDDRGTITYISPSASRVFGWLPGEMIGRSFSEFLLESEIPKAMQAFQTAISTGQPNRSLIMLMKRRDNSVFLGELKGSPLAKKLSGTGTLGLIHDISERKRAESQKEAALEELQKSSQLLKDSGEIANVGGWELDLSTQELSWTEEVCRIHGVELGYRPTLEEAVNFYAPEHRWAIEAVLKKTAETGAPFDLEVLFIPRGSKDKIWVRSLGKAVYSDGKIAKLAGTIQNIDKYKRVEAALGESEVRFRELFNRMSSGVAVYEAVDDGGDFVIKDFNPAAEKIEQVSSKDIIGKRVSEAFPGVKAFGVFKVFQRVWQTGEAEYYPENIYKNEKNSGSWQESWRESWVFKLPSGEIVSIYNDISERKQAGEEIKRQLAEKEILLKEVHHRIKNNIASIGGLLTLQAQAATNPEAITVLQDAIGRVTSMQILYDKLLLTEGYKDISVKNYVESLVTSVVALFPETAKVILEQRITDFQLDPKQLSPLGIIINELLTNIMKYAFTNRDTGLIQIVLTNIDKHVTLTIQDNGNGLPAGFDLNESQGFGLMLVKMLSQQLGGTFSIKMHEGTLCRVEFDII